MPLVEQMQAEGLDEGGFADAGHAGDAEPQRAAGMGQDFRDQRFRVGAVVGAGRFEQRNGARQGTTLTGQQAGGKPVRRFPVGHAGYSPKFRSSAFMAMKVSFSRCSGSRSSRFDSSSRAVRPAPPA